MKLRTLLIFATLPAVMVMGQRAGAEDSYPLIAYAAPADMSLVSLHTTAPGLNYFTEQSLFSSPTSSVKTGPGIIEQWRERVFQSLSAANLTPDAKNGGQLVTRTAMQESMKLVLERNPGIAQIVKMLKLEVSTDMFAPNKDKNTEEPEIAPAAAAPPVRHETAKDRFFMKTGLLLPIDQGKAGLRSETSAVYGNFTSFFNMRLDSKHDSGLGFRYALSRDMRVQVERTTADVAVVDPTIMGAATTQRSTSNTVKLIFKF